MTNSLNSSRKIAYSAIFLAIGLVLPFLTAQIPQIGQALLPMHIPVLICGIVCGGIYGGIVGFILPILRSVMFGMPVLMPMGFAMAFELAAYGIVIGVCYKMLKNNKLNVYIALIVSMILGRIVWGAAMAVFMQGAANAFTFNSFISMAVISGVPGIILQLILVPAVILMLQKTGVMANKNVVVYDDSTNK